jgi:hypothetical protein
MRRSAPRVGRQLLPPSVRMSVGQTRQRLPHTVRSRPEKVIVCLGRPLRGPHHADRMFKPEWPPVGDGWSAVAVGVDLGYQGRQADDAGERMAMPHTKPRTRKKKPAPAWPAAHRAAHKALSQGRRCIEPALGGRKRCTILVQSFRHRQDNFEDDALGICAGLGNLTLCY